ncbi:MAG TPA: oligosaccharide flippase family protein, partial [Burkholderiales bacterium]|nr:oligosaccharide flippase family protein [Burkholderiales bacterium]
MRALLSLAAKVRPHASNAAWSSAEYVFYPLLMLVATPVFIATIGTADFGLLMFVNAITGLGSAGSLGMGAATIKFVSSALGRGDRAEAAESIRASLAVALAGNTAVAIAIALAHPWLAHTVFAQMGDADKVGTAILLASGILVIAQTDSMFGAALRGMERFGTAARLEIGFKLLAIGAAMAVAWLTHDVIDVLMTSAAFYVASALAKGTMASRLVGVPWLLPRLKNRAIARGVIRFGSWNWLTTMGGLLFVHADRLLIGALLGAQAVAFYSACTQLAQQVHALPAAAMGFLFPLMSRKAHTADARALERVR